MYLCGHTHLFPTNFHVFYMQMPVTLYPTRERLSKYIHTGLPPPTTSSKFLPIFYVNLHQKSYIIYSRKYCTIKYLVILKKPIYFKCCCLKKYFCKKYMPVIVPANAVLCTCACTSGSCTL